MKYTWVFDIREKSNPVSIATHADAVGPGLHQDGRPVRSA